MEEKFEISFEIKNKNIKNVYLDPNAFGWDVKEGDVLRIVIDEHWVPRKLFDKGTPFTFEIMEDSVTLWFDVLPEKIFLNDKEIS